MNKNPVYKIQRRNYADAEISNTILGRSGTVVPMVVTETLFPTENGWNEVKASSDTFGTFRFMFSSRPSSYYGESLAYGASVAKKKFFPDSKHVGEEGEILRFQVGQVLHLLFNDLGDWTVYWNEQDLHDSRLRDALP